MAKQDAMLKTLRDRIGARLAQRSQIIDEIAATEARLEDLRASRTKIEGAIYELTMMEAELTGDQPPAPPVPQISEPASRQQRRAAARAEKATEPSAPIARIVPSTEDKAAV